MNVARNCPTIYRLAGPDGKARLLVFAGQGPDGALWVLTDDKDGRLIRMSAKTR